MDNIIIKGVVAPLVAFVLLVVAIIIRNIIDEHFH